MALKHFGTPDNDQGEWYPFGLDAPFELRIRRIPPSVAERLDTRHKGQEKFEVIDGIRRPVRDLLEIVKTLTDRAVWALTDARGLKVQLGDNESVAYWRKATASEAVPEGDQALQVGDELELSGERLTAEIKRLIVSELKPIARTTNAETGVQEFQEVGVFIVRKAGELQRDFAKLAEDLGGN